MGPCVYIGARGKQVYPLTKGTMSDLIKVTSTTIDGIEFYVSQDGSVTGMSQRGLAKLVGLSENSVRNKITLFELEPLQVNAPRRATNLSNNVNLLDGPSCVRLITYYAFEATKVSEEVTKHARFSLGKFASMGFDTWVKTITGYEAPQVISTGVIDRAFLENMKQITEDLLSIQNACDAAPGLKAILDRAKLEDQAALEPANRDRSYWKHVSEYVHEKDIELTFGELSTVGRMVASTFKDLYKVSPRTRKTLGNRKPIYGPKDWPIIDNAIETVLEVSLLKKCPY